MKRVLHHITIAVFVLLLLYLAMNAGYIRETFDNTGAMIQMATTSVPRAYRRPDYLPDPLNI